MLTIAYLGPEHTNTHAAAQKRFGQRCKYVHAPTIEDVFHSVERRKVDYGVVPIENSLEGAVTHTLDRFIDFVDTPVKIHGEREQQIHHCLIVHRGVKTTDVRRVYSHPQALAQCREWLDRHVPRAPRLETNSTAEAVGRLFSKNMSGSIGSIMMKDYAAIGREELALQYRLKAVPIPDRRENKTRFLIIGLGNPKRGPSNKTCILFGVKDKPGALHEALLAFKRERINMTKIESRPSKRKAWEYLFFVDIEGHESEPRVRRALVALRRSTSLLRVLGSYPVAR